MYAYYCFNKLHWKPHEYDSLPFKEKALVIAFINERVRQEKRQNIKTSRMRGR